ncbi:T9SS type A sorting domain-containing protein [Psychroserpens sp. MEBiC05023]
MKTLVTYIIILITISTYSQQVFQLDSTLTQNWQASTDEWLNNIKAHYYYDNGDINDTRVYQFMYAASSWDSISRETKVYHNDNLTESTFESFDGSQWNYNTRRELTYNANSQVTLEEGYLFAGTWLNDSSVENMYDTSGNLTEELYKAIDFISGQLLNDRRNLYTYDNMDALLEQDISQIWLSNIWYNQIRRDYFYLPNDLVDYIDRFEWLGSSWSGITERTLFFYNTDDLVIEARSQTDNGSMLENDSRVLNTYDTSFNVTQITGQEWNGSDWDNLTNLIQNYDSDNNIEEQITQTWDIPNNEWLNQIRTLSYWSLAENLSITFHESPQINIYPNPSTNVITIDFKSPIQEISKIKIFDSVGKQIISKQIDKQEKTITLPLTAQNTGVYILHISNSTIDHVFKIIKQ